MNVYIIAGPNGAGKTTFAREFLLSYANCKTFINADLIAAALSPSAPEAAAFEAGRRLLGEIKTCMERKEDFGFETTLSGRGHLKLIEQLKVRGYRTHLFYLWVPSADASLLRVKERVLKGGHDVPESDVRRRFGRSLSNFFTRYRDAVDAWLFFDNSGREPRVVAYEKQGYRYILDKSLHGRLENEYANE